MKNIPDEFATALIVCHVPFTEKFRRPFDIEKDVYGEWSRLLRESIKPQLMLCGHIRRAYISRAGCERDYQGQPCTMVVASYVIKSEENPVYYGGALTLYPDRCNVKINSKDDIMLDEDIIF